MVRSLKTEIFEMFMKKEIWEGGSLYSYFICSLIKMFSFTISKLEV